MVHKGTYAQSMYASYTSVPQTIQLHQRSTTLSNRVEADLAVALIVSSGGGRTGPDRGLLPKEEHRHQGMLQRIFQVQGQHHQPCAKERSFSETKTGSPWMGSWEGGGNGRRGFATKHNRALGNILFTPFQSKTSSDLGFRKPGTLRKSELPFSSFFTPACLVKRCTAVDSAPPTTTTCLESHPTMGRHLNIIQYPIPVTKSRASANQFFEIVFLMEKALSLSLSGATLPGSIP